MTKQMDTSDIQADEERHGAAPSVCMHVHGPARTDQRVMREASALAEAGYRVTVVDVEPDRQRPHEEVVDGVRLRHIVMPSWFVSTRFKPWFLVKLVRMLAIGSWNLFRTHADVYHAQDISALPMCYVVALLRGKQLIYDAHELPLEGSVYTRWPRLSAFAVRVLRQITARCVAVITVSPPIGPVLRERFGSPEVAIIRNLPHYTAPLNSDRLRTQLGVSADTRIALYQGYLLEDRWLDGLVRAAAHLDDGHLIVILGKGQMTPILERLIAQEGVGDRVKLVSAVPYAELLSWTASADLGLTLFAPDYSESIRLCLPNKLFEYLMAGLPVLSSALPAIEEVIHRYGVGRVVSPLNPERVGGAISALLNDVDALARMRKNALAAAKQELCWEVERMKLVSLYDAIAPHHGETLLSSAPSDGAKEAAADRLMSGYGQRE
jgi:glycosyltransferase involved in cell wall biosynthesis